MSFQQYSILKLILFYQKYKKEKPGNLQTKHCFFGYRRTLNRKYLRDAHSGKFDVGSRIYNTYIVLYVGINVILEFLHWLQEGFIVHRAES